MMMVQVITPAPAPKGCSVGSGNYGNTCSGG
jgi:hypothetical protein